MGSAMSTLCASVVPEREVGQKQAQAYLILWMEAVLGSVLYTHMDTTEEHGNIELRKSHAVKYPLRSVFPAALWSFIKLSCLLLLTLWHKCISVYSYYTSSTLTKMLIQAAEWWFETFS